MTFKNNLKSRQGQAIVEYVVTFIAIAAGVIMVFHTFSPQGMNVKSTFSTTITKAITEINQQ
jgi:multidrug resistance efflux pump